MTDLQRGFIAQIRAHADEEINYNAGWDVVAEAMDDEELLEHIGGETEEEHAEKWKGWGDTAPPRELPAATYEEAFTRVKEIVDIHEEQRRAAQNEVF
jgi:hypothetical protein